MQILVTGAAGYFGRTIIPALLADPRVARVVGTDRLPADGLAFAGHPSYSHATVDLARATPEALDALLAGHDTVIHLAFEVVPIPGHDPAPSNVAAQAAFLPRALAAPRRVIVASAVAVYGFDAGRDAMTACLGEDAPRHPGTGVAYAEHKQQLEDLLDRLAPTVPATIIRARPTNVGGPHMPAKRAPLLGGQVVILPMTKHPIRQQLLHEDDLASAFVRLLDAPAGAYNLAPDDWLTLEDAATLLGQTTLRMPSWALRPVADVAWRLGQSAFDATWLAFLEHAPIIVDNRRLRALGWAPAFTTAQAMVTIPAAARRSVEHPSQLG